MSEVFARYDAPLRVKLDNFEKYIRRQSLARLLARYEIFKLQTHVKGSIIEAGVHHGGGLMAWAKLSADLEPYALDRRIIGFDTFEGFPEIAEQDKGGQENASLAAGGLAAGYDVHAELTELIAEFDANRFLNQFPKVHLVKGDACETIPRFIRDNPHLLVSLLFMDFDLYEPTKAALEHFLPRMGAGAVLVFDELNNPWWPGEMRAVLEMLNLREHRIHRFAFDPSIAYIVL